MRKKEIWPGIAKEEKNISVITIRKLEEHLWLEDKCHLKKMLLDFNLMDHILSDSLTIPKESQNRCLVR
jgi:hypothetical protein